MHYRFFNPCFVLLALLVVGCSSMNSHQSTTELYGEDFYTDENGIVREKLQTFDASFPLEFNDQVLSSQGEIERLVAQAKERAEEEEFLRYLSDGLYLKASHASMREDSVTAERLLKHLLTLFPSDELIMRRYAVELIKNGKLGEAEKIVLQIYDLVGRKDENIALILGGIYTALDQRKKAQDIYEEVLVKSPANREACIFLAKSYAIDQKMSESKSILRNCYKQATENSTKAVFVNYLATVYLEEEDHKSAIEYFQKSLKYRPNFFQSIMAIGMIYESIGKPKKAIEAYRDYLVYDSLNRAVLSQLVQLYFSHGENVEEILPYAHRLIFLDPSNLNLKVRVGIIYSDLGEYEKAISTFEEVLEEVPNADRVLYYVATLYHQIGDADLAITYYSKIPETSPLFHEGIVQIGEILSVQAFESVTSRTPAAVDDPTKEKGLRPGDVKKNKLIDHIDGHFSLDSPRTAIELKVIMASFYEALNKYKNAAYALDEVSELEMFTLHHHYYHAALYEKAGLSDEATRIIRKILAEEPDHAHALNFLGYTMIERGENLPEAYRLIKRAVELKPEDGHIRDSLGWYYYKIGELDKALEEIKKARALLERQDMTITKHLAIIYQEMKEYSRARELFQEALELCTADYEREKIYQHIQNLDAENQERFPASALTSEYSERED